MSIEELKRKFIVDEDVVKARLEDLLAKAVEHCAVDKHGNVHINNSKMSGPNKFKLVLSARYLAAQLEPSITGEVTITEMTRNTGLPAAQVSARAKDAVDERFAEAVAKGKYRVLPHKIDSFLSSLNGKKKS